MARRIFIDPLTQIRSVPMWSEYYRRPCPERGDNHTAFRCDDEQHCCPPGSDDSPINGESVDLERFPEFAGVEWRHARVEAGDCLYIPAFHLHYVRSWGRNVAVSYMWQTAERLDEDAQAVQDADATGEPAEAQEDEGEEWASLGGVELLWDYPNPDQVNGEQCRMGYPDWRRMLVEPLLEACAEETAGGDEARLSAACVDEWYAGRAGGRLAAAARATGALLPGGGAAGAVDGGEEPSLASALVQLGCGPPDGASGGAGRLRAGSLYSAGPAALWRRLLVLEEGW